MILTKNSLTQLDVFFWKKSFQNIHRPDISYLKVDSYSEVKQAYHIGFKESMGYLESFDMHVGAMVFEVLEGYPLQSLLITNNKKKGIHSGFKYSLKDLEPMDFFCIQEKGEDPYGDFILKNVKFFSTKMEQGTNTPGRKMVAQFVCSAVIPFKLPYFYNEFISDNYNHHIIRGKSEIDQIVKDIVRFGGIYSDKADFNAELNGRFKDALNIEYDNTMDSTDSLENLLIKKWKQFQRSYAHNQNNNLFYYQEIKDIKDFIAVFYEWKNNYELKNIKNSTRMKDLLKYFNTSEVHSGV